MKLNTAIRYLLPPLFFSAFTIQIHAQSTVIDTVPIVMEGEKYIGFGKQKNSLVTGAVSTVKAEVLRPGFTNNISNTLYGRFPGLTVNQGGNEPGANSSNIFIRGVNTFGFNNSPLVIIDGFLGEYDQLVPEEIEEISVLKDAAAAAIYGMRGVNGVLLVTTKKGQVQPLQLNFRAQYGIQSATSLPQFLNSYDYARLYNEALANDGKAPLYSQTDLDLYQNGSDPMFNWADVRLLSDTSIFALKL